MIFFPNVWHHFEFHHSEVFLLFLPTRSQSWEFGSQEVVSSTRRPRRLLIIKRVKLNWVDIYWGRKREIGWRFKEKKGKERRDNKFFLGVKFFFLFIYFKIMWHVLIRLKNLFILYILIRIQIALFKFGMILILVLMWHLIVMLLTKMNKMMKFKIMSKIKN